MAQTKRQRLERQRVNTERWFDSHAGKKEEQNVKARVRMANLRLKRKREAQDDAANTRGSSEPLDFPSSDEDGEASTAAPNQNPAVRSIRKSRIDITHWTWNLGPESSWEPWVVEEIRLATIHDTVETFCEVLRGHALAGRELLHDLQLLCHVLLPGGSVEEMQDLFLQSHELTVALLSEIKFVEIKANEHI
ncbi:hypothetical protein FIBSPDRAFT_876336 [Athelia psychrophila]|uniref:Uncharacterized protein n=1 Tax=Athelia psychrophila TaxID=1759441 RepID=A0A167WZN9_9AGAM|nr:hypothetical protein FIBSPDRAFT_876336 [Fibularhizoctonia sp. CBS 109695]